MEAYRDPDFARRLETHLAQHGLGGSGPLSPEGILSMDQFHVGGPEPILRLIEHAELQPSSRVLDLGSGLGGCARLVAHRTGASVLGIDATGSYVAAARTLTARCGLQSQVSFAQGDVTALDLADGYADAAILAHVQVNIAPKVDLFRELRRVLRPGGRLLLWELTSERPDELSWPMPWSLDGTASHLVSTDTLRQAAEEAGFEVRHWEDRGGWAKTWAQQAQRLQQADPPPRPNLPGLLIDGPKRISNLARAILAGDVSPVEGVCVA